MIEYSIMYLLLGTAVVSWYKAYNYTEWDCTLKHFLIAVVIWPVFGFCLIKKGRALHNERLHDTGWFKISHTSPRIWHNSESSLFSPEFHSQVTCVWEDPV